MPVTAVTIEGEPWRGFDAEDRSVTLPLGPAVNVTVILGGGLASDEAAR